MAGFIHCLAPRLGSIRSVWRDKVAGIRSQAAGGGRHARTPGIIAELRLAFSLLMEFARASGAVDNINRACSECWESLLEAAERQHDHQQANEPASQFLRLLSAVISSGAGHLAGVGGDSPADNPPAWGWRWRVKGIQDGDWEPAGRRVGWIDGNDILLEPDAAFAAVQRLAGEQG